MTTAGPDALLRHDRRAGHPVPVPDGLEPDRLGEPPGRDQAGIGYGLGNYVTLLNYGNGAPLYFLNSVVISL